ncbi:hypothetical protein [Elizabethkingia meningoseptica]|uniref:hypothetical protein n=1 Tax=Elizabethkingia meningoseptica TaxID=238 RepID=UPI003891CA87
MKKLIFILISMLLITACSSDRDNNNPTEEVKPLEKDLLSTNLRTQWSPYRIKVNTATGIVAFYTKGNNDSYIVVNKDKIVTLKIFDDTYSGPIIKETDLISHFIFSDSKTGNKIQIELGSDGAKLKTKGINVINRKGDNYSGTYTTDAIYLYTY